MVFPHSDEDLTAPQYSAHYVAELLQEVKEQLSGVLASEGRSAHAIRDENIRNLIKEIVALSARDAAESAPGAAKTDPEPVSSTTNVDQTEEVESTGLCCMCGMDGVKGSFLKRGFKCSRCVGSHTTLLTPAAVTAADSASNIEKDAHPYAVTRLPSSAGSLSKYHVTFIPSGTVRHDEANALFRKLRLLAHPALLYMFACGFDSKRQRYFFVHERAMPVMQFVSDGTGRVPQQLAQDVQQQGVTADRGDAVCEMPMASFAESDVPNDSMSPRSVLLCKSTTGSFSKAADSDELGLVGFTTSSEQPLSPETESKFIIETVIRSTVHLEFVRKVAFSVLQALEVLHAHRIVHGACNLENIVVDNDGNARLRCALVPERSVTWSRSDPMFLPPEALKKDSPPLVVAADLYMLGSSLAVLLLDPNRRAPSMSPKSLVQLALRQHNTVRVVQASDGGSRQTSHMHLLTPFLQLLDRLLSDDSQDRGSAAKALKHDVFALVRVANGIAAENIFVTISVAPFSVASSHSGDVESMAHSTSSAPEATASVRRCVSWATKVTRDGTASPAMSAATIVPAIPHHDKDDEASIERESADDGSLSPTTSVGSSRKASLQQLRAKLSSATENSVFVLDIPGRRHDAALANFATFIKDHGPRFQLVRFGTSSMTLYSVRSDPRRRRYSDASSTSPFSHAATKPSTKTSRESHLVGEACVPCE